ncbi:hypothetical protein [Amycolatopsis sp.]|jgi:hypothetical protein|nr:hypothetical protein [Amycolatopsis sp.]
MTNTRERGMRRQYSGAVVAAVRPSDDREPLSALEQELPSRADSPP